MPQCSQEVRSPVVVVQRPFPDRVRVLFVVYADLLTLVSYCVLGDFSKIDKVIYDRCVYVSARSYLCSSSYTGL